MSADVRWTLGPMERRKLGVTRENLLAILAEMDEAGEVQGKSAEVIAVGIFRRLQQQRPQAFCEAEVGGMDWDAFLEFLEQVIPLLLPLLIKARKARASAV